MPRRWTTGSAVSTRGSRSRMRRRRRALCWDCRDRSRSWSRARAGAEGLAGGCVCYKRCSCSWSSHDPRGRNVVGEDQCLFVGDGVPDAGTHPLSHAQPVTRANMSCCSHDASLPKATQAPPAPKLQDLVAFSVVGNKRNGKYHLPHCSGYSQINLENRVEFASQLRQKRQGIDGQEIVHELLLELVHATTHQRQSHGGLRGWC